MKKLPNSYRITEADYKEASKVFSSKAEYVAVMEKRDYRAQIVQAFHDAGKMHYKSGVWPTLGEVYAQWAKEHEERELKRERVIQRHENEKQKQTTA